MSAAIDGRPPSLTRRDMVALAFAMTFPSVMSWLEFWVLPGQSEGTNLGIIFGLGKIVQFTFPLIYVQLFARDEIRLHRPNARGLAPALGFAALAAVGMCILYFAILRGTPLFADTPAKLAALLAHLHSNTPTTYFYMAFFIAIIHPMLEEYYWRWFVFGRLQRVMPMGWAMAVASLSFMSHHVFVLSYYFPGWFWTAAVPFSLCVAVAGAVWCWMYRRYGTLYAPYLSHVLTDIAVMAVGFDMVQK